MTVPGHGGNLFATLIVTVSKNSSVADEKHLCPGLSKNSKQKLFWTKLDRHRIVLFKTIAIGER